MLKNKILKIEVIEWGIFSITMLITSITGATDEINVDTLVDSLLIRLDDRTISSYNLIGEKISNKIEKTTGALAGGIFKLSDEGAYFFNEITKENDDVYYEGSRNTYTIYIGNFQINLKLTEELEEKPIVDIVERIV